MSTVVVRIELNGPIKQVELRTDGLINSIDTIKLEEWTGAKLVKLIKTIKNQLNWFKQVEIFNFVVVIYKINAYVYSIVYLCILIFYTNHVFFIYVHEQTRSFI